MSENEENNDLIEVGVSTINGNEELEKIYNEMNRKNNPFIKTPIINSNLEEGRCYAVYSMGDWYLKPSFRRLCAAIEKVLPKSAYCLYSAFSKSDNEGVLHQTLLQFIGFDKVKENVFTEEEIELSAKRIESILRKRRKAMWIRYRGLVWTPTGLAFSGYLQDPDDYEYIMEIRETIKKELEKNGLPVSIPYTNDIVHSTFLRWTEQPTEDMLTLLQKEVIRWEECEFGEIRIKDWIIGKGSWRMQPHERTDISTIHLYRHICHRGNIYGEEVKGEDNKPINLLFRNVERRDVECDVWYKGGDIWLGHDRPIHKTYIDWLIESPRRLLHAKDGETFSYLLKEAGKRAADAHIFYHTDEDYVLTNKGIPIAYPGRQLIDGGLCMMPERACYSEDEMKKSFCVCSDSFAYQFKK